MRKEKEVKRNKPWRRADVAELKLRVPAEVLMLCKLMNTTPHEVVQAFLSCLAVEKDKKNPGEAKEASGNFFIRYGFGKDYYSEDEIRQMFSEIGKVNDLWPDGAPIKFIDEHAYWRRKYSKNWFKRWYWKIRRK
jgi:hypothetical protein